MTEVLDFVTLTPEDLDASERRVPVYAIANMLTWEQLSQVWEDNLIKASLLTPVQMAEVNAALEFDNNLAQIGHDVKAWVHNFL